MRGSQHQCGMLSCLCLGTVRIRVLHCPESDGLFHSSWDLCHPVKRDGTCHNWLQEEAGSWQQHDCHVPAVIRKLALQQAASCPAMHVLGTPGGGGCVLAGLVCCSKNIQIHHTKQLVAAHINFNSLRGGTVGTCSQQAPRAVGRCIVCFTRGLQPTACVWQITHSAACMHCCLARCSIGSQNGPYTILPRVGLKLHSDCSCELWVCHGSLF